MTDRILVRDLRAETILGVHDRERESKREVVVQLEIEADLSQASRSDELDHTVDYGDLSRRVITHVEESSFRLIERLAGSIADLVLVEFPSVDAITVTVDKPGAIPAAAGAAVRIERRRR